MSLWLWGENELLDQNTARRRTATHESCHAVMAHVLAKNVTEVSCLPARDGSLGQCQFAADSEIHGDDNATRLAAEDFLLVHLAGPIGEHLAFGTWSLADASKDFQQAESCALILTGGDVTKAKTVLQDSRSIVTSILLLNWHPVLAVADALTQRGTLDGPSFRQTYSLASMAPLSRPPVPPGSASIASGDRLAHR